MIALDRFHIHPVKTRHHPRRHDPDPSLVLRMPMSIMRNLYHEDHLIMLLALR